VNDVWQANACLDKFISRSFSEGTVLDNERKKMKKIICAALLTFMCASNVYAAELFTKIEKKKMIQLTLESFWGKAIDSQGNPVQPKDEKERTTIPISELQANHMINKGGESGLAQWCGVDWQERYQLIILQLKKHITSDTQVAYAGVLHGLAQQMIYDAMKKETCDAETRAQTASIIAEDVKNIKLSLDEK